MGSIRNIQIPKSWSKTFKILFFNKWLYIIYIICKKVYYEDQKRHKLVKVKNSSTLLEVLQKEGNFIQLGTPKFFVMVKDSEFKKIYIDKYNEIA